MRICITGASIIIEEKCLVSVLKGGFVFVAQYRGYELRGVEVKSMIDLVLVKEDTLCYVKALKAVKGMGRGLADHHVILDKVRLVEA